MFRAKVVNKCFNNLLIVKEPFFYYFCHSKAHAIPYGPYTQTLAVKQIQDSGLLNIIEAKISFAKFTNEDTPYFPSC